MIESTWKDIEDLVGEVIEDGEVVVDDVSDEVTAAFKEIKSAFDCFIKN